MANKKKLPRPRLLLPPWKLPLLPLPLTLPLLLLTLLPLLLTLPPLLLTLLPLPLLLPLPPSNWPEAVKSRPSGRLFYFPCASACCRNSDVKVDNFRIRPPSITHKNK